MTRKSLRVGDFVQKSEYGRKAMVRRVEAIGEQEYNAGYVKVSGLLGWYSENHFNRAKIGLSNSYDLTPENKLRRQSDTHFSKSD